MDSFYFDKARISQAVAEGRHREMIGGAWEEIGRLQFSFMLSEGLRPHHTFLDIGCGSLRGGVHFVPYLDKGRYFGVDMNQALLDSGRKELDALGCQDRLPMDNLHCSDDFDFAKFGQSFDFAIAHSVFTHLTFNRIRRCLEKVSDFLVEGGVLFATFFNRADEVPGKETRTHQPGGVQTHDAKDPYHYSVEDFRHAIRNLPLDLRYIGEWGHPRGQQILAFRKHATITTNIVQRSLNVDEAMLLPPGAHHYRAYVGPPDRFDFMGASQFSLLWTLGLRDRHKLLDFGCGSLRLGRLAIPYLRSGRYFGIDPNGWLIEDALQFELGRDIVEIKQPRFSFNADFECGVFGTSFDFVIAQSIVTHCGPDLFQRLVSSAAKKLNESGVFAFSYCAQEARGELPPEGWQYPHCVFYDSSAVAAFLKEAELFGQELPWYHPGARWHVAARDPSRLPSKADLHLLRGAVFHDPQFAASRS